MNSRRTSIAMYINFLPSVSVLTSHTLLMMYVLRTFIRHYNPQPHQSNRPIKFVSQPIKKMKFQQSRDLVDLIGHLSLGIGTRLTSRKNKSFAGQPRAKGLAQD